MEVPFPPGTRSSQKRVPGGWSVLRRVMDDRRGADLCACPDGSRPADALRTTQGPAVRVDGRGGGLRGLDRPRGGGCLTQRRELDGRVDGPAHQLAERALVRAACGRWGEHVFVKLRSPSDGTRGGGGGDCPGPRIWLYAGLRGAPICKGSCTGRFRIAFPEWGSSTSIASGSATRSATSRATSSTRTGSRTSTSR